MRAMSEPAEMSGRDLLEAALREVREEAGHHVRVRPLGVVHASTFEYDARVRRMISVVFLMAHEGGAAVPGDDMPVLGQS